MTIKLEIGQCWETLHTRYLHGLFDFNSPPYDPTVDYTPIWRGTAISDLAALRINLACNGYLPDYEINARNFIMTGQRSHPSIEAIIARCAPPTLLDYMNRQLTLPATFKPPPLLTPHGLVDLPAMHWPR